jgi:hypothetical protein
MSGLLPVMPAELLERCGKHDQAITDLITAREDSKKENDARQREISQAFQLVRVSSERVDDKISKSTENVNILAVSITEMKVLQEQDHILVKDHDTQLREMRDSEMRNAGAQRAVDKAQTKTHNYMTYIASLLSAVIGYLVYLFSHLHWTK